MTRHSDPVGEEPQGNTLVDTQYPANHPPNFSVYKFTTSFTTNNGAACYLSV
jgi:hypothetical protein